MKNPDLFFHDLILRIGEQSKCKGRHVGCLIVLEDHILGQGYNSAPIGSDCKDCPRPKCSGIKSASGVDLNLAICAHAEANAIGFCARHGISTRNTTIYLPCFPCSECAKLIVAAGIKEVVYDKAYSSASDNLSRLILENAKINIRKFII